MITHSAFVSACALALAAGYANATVTTVYKCFDRNLGVLYTDQPCRGEQLSIEGGSVDPVAIAELQREREAVARAAAQRVTELRRVDVAQQYYAGSPVVPQGPQYGGGDMYYPSDYGYAPLYDSYNNDRRGRPDQDRGHNQRNQRHVPAPRGDLIKR